ncbi:FUSC family protein [Methylobacterium gregans]|uniref:p-hydroxybenzoic acid efflux pump subunit AaeB n=1 Tax=Methylobacterium gregans TaxID=374424 RepID=A0AA37HQ44_9HYPH|nr:FUSC family protein [Methylobacterium gregans]MDQ0523096.1 putative membrane protein YccC [Methylobacterium gregans]GJD79778.1 p-hydroxybenzoic acid efflux pump subunit AaeB [Methylobacterium gregans]GLS56952.1 fusaric acid transporter [Methylobacterium gregans]
MTLPGWRDWAFSIKTFGAAMLALFLALWIDLPKPYWALGTVYITSQVLAGATRSKAVYRVGGTVLGAVVTVILVPNLVDAPELLVLAIALWVALCLYVSLLDRTPRSYLMMLGGYTAALIGFPSVGEPGAIFDTAVARAQEITLGILCASLVSSVVLPQSVVPAIARRLDLWLSDARAWVGDVLGRAGPAEDTQAKRLRLASDAIAFDALATPLRYDMTGAERSAEAMAILRQHMLMFLPIVSAIADRIETLERAQALPPRLRGLLDEMAAWIEAGITDPAEAARLRAAAGTLAPALGARPTWNDLVMASLLSRLIDFIDLRQDTRLLQRHMADGTPVHEHLAFRYTAAARTIRHRDHGMALLSAIGVFLSILLTCAIWITTGWPDGAGAPMMAAVACSLFAVQDDPAPSILGFANSAIVAALGAGIYLFAILPLATSFEMLVLALAPGLLICGVFMAQPRTAPLAMGAALNGSTMIALQTTYSADFAAFTNSAVAVILGMWTAALVTRLVRSVGAGWSARRLRAVNRRSLARAARRHGAQNGLELAALMLDRVGLIAPRLAALPPDDAEWTADLLAEVRVGINVVELRRDRRRLSEPGRAAVERLLADLARHFEGGAEEPPAELLAGIDAALDAVCHDAGRAAGRAALMGLVGIRRGLFPDAGPYRTSASAASHSELAA